MANADVEAFFDRLDAPLREVAAALRALVREAAPRAKEALKWGVPCYEQDGLVCSISPARDYVRLQLFRGALISDPHGLLAGTGKGMRHVKARSLDGIPSDSDALRELVAEAVRLNAAG
jgi:hypothetical protein